MQAADQQEIDWKDGKITEAGLAYLAASVGKYRAAPGWNNQVSADGIWHYALGTGDDNPLWWDQDYALKSPWKARIAPPCYLYTHLAGPRIWPKDGKIAVEEFLPGVLGLWASELWQWNRPAREGEKIRAMTGISDFKVHEGGKFGGRSVSHVETTRYVTPDDEIVGQCHRTIKRFERAATRDKSPYLNRPLAVWTEADRRRFSTQYASESTLRRGAEPRMIEDVRIGEKLGPMLKGPLTIFNMIGFMMGWGGPLTATNRILDIMNRNHPGIVVVHPETGAEENIEVPHWETALAKLGGFPSGYDFGGQRISWISHLLTDWMGDHGFLIELDTRLLKPNFLNDVSWINGEVVAIEGDEATIVLSVTNQLEEVTASARAKVRLPRK